MAISKDKKTLTADDRVALKTAIQDLVDSQDEKNAELRELHANYVAARARILGSADSLATMWAEKMGTQDLQLPDGSTTKIRARRGLGATATPEAKAKAAARYPAGTPSHYFVDFFFDPEAADEENTAAPAAPSLWDE